MTGNDSAATYARTRFLAEGCRRPTDAELEAFWRRANAELADADLPDDFTVRWIGGNAESTRNILNHIRSGAKTGTVSLPRVLEATGRPATKPGDAIVLIDFDGTPSLLVQIVAVEPVPYGRITTAHTALDGPKVRPLEIWKPVHLGYFNMLLEPLGETVSDATLILFEKFELLYGT